MHEDDPAACEIARLPSELLAEVLALTSPRDACRAAADSDAVWSRFLGDFCLVTDKFSEVVELLHGDRVDICGKIPCKMHSGSSDYAAYLVFVIHMGWLWSEGMHQSASVGGRRSTRQVCLDISNYKDEVEVPQDGSVFLPQERADGWMELELGEFYNEECSNEDFVVELKGRGLLPTRGLVVQGIEIRPKKSGRSTISPPSINSHHQITRARGGASNRSKEESSIHPSMADAEEDHPAACEIARLPTELLVEVLALTTPRDACRTAAVCREFLASADSDAVWSRFLPGGDFPLLADGELEPSLSLPPPSTKGLFLRLSAAPLLLPDELKVRSLLAPHPQTLAMCFWLLLVLYRFSNRIGLLLLLLLLCCCAGERAQVLHALGQGATNLLGRYAAVLGMDSYRRFKEIHAKIPSKMLSLNTNYAAYLVYKLADGSRGLDFPFQEASVSIGGSKTICQVGIAERRLKTRYPTAVVLARDVEHPQKRDDSWIELKLGELYNEEGDDGEVCISLMETKGGNWKSGLVVQGIEIRPKKTPPFRSLPCSHEKPAYPRLTTSRSCMEEMFLPDGLMSMWLDKETGFKCYMLSARALNIEDYPANWCWISLTGGCRFSKVVELSDGWMLDIHAKIPCKMLSGNSNYAVYIVFVVAEDSYGLDAILDASVSVGKNQFSTHQVCLDSSSCLGEDDYYYYDKIEVPQDGSVLLPQERADCWMELELGEFYNDEGDNWGEVCLSLVEPKEGRWLGKGGLVVQGIEIRPKNSGR
uniref:F-box domain-containing protein n=1 Tax=Leersia perrieri TaxID=77586 RepID=A0A0D9VMI3_9ORYZ